jgi:DNA-binding NtrC family response regulator
VDDEHDLTDLLGEILGGEGYDITTAADGDEAIRILGEGHFDAVLLDIMMPKRNGIDVLKHVTKHHPGTKTIMVTGYSNLKAAVEAKQIGAADYITKPYKFQTILATLQRVLAG